MIWKFVKNVPYTEFQHIKHGHNDQPIVNMWNGMHFPFDVGRKVVKIYVKYPHLTNVVAWDKSKPYRPGFPLLDMSILDPRKTRGRLNGQ